MPTAATITIKQTLDLLDGYFKPLGTAFDRGEYALWLGSAISRERVAALDGVLRKLIEFLRTKISGASDCPFRHSLNLVVAKADLSAGQFARVDYGADSATWPDIKLILKRLSEKYSHVLDIGIRGEVQDYLLWNGVDFANTFSNQEPDAEHLCVGILVLEGVVTHLVSANWDGLLEAAIEELGHTNFTYRICVTGIDFRGPVTAATLLKFHGCALRAILDETKYRGLIIARYSQIVGWGFNQAFGAMKNELIRIAAQQRTLMIGMSAQDINIQQIFSAAKNSAAWQWTQNPAPHVFAEDTITDGQRTILRQSYGDDFHPNQTVIESRAHLRAFAKPLLSALVLNTLSSKFCGLLRALAPLRFVEADYLELEKGLIQLRNLTAENVGADFTAYIRAIARHLSRMKAILQDGEVLDAPRVTYRAITGRPVHLMQTDANLGITGQREAAYGLALIGLAELDQLWHISLDNLADKGGGAVRLTSTTGTSRLIFVANDNVALKLFDEGVFAEDDPDVVLVHSSSIRAARQRSPSRAIGRPGRRQAQHVDMQQLLNEMTNLAELRDRFRRGVGL